MDNLCGYLCNWRTLFDAWVSSVDTGNRVASYVNAQSLHNCRVSGTHNNSLSAGSEFPVFLYGFLSFRVISQSDRLTSEFESRRYALFGGTYTSKVCINPLLSCAMASRIALAVSSLFVLGIWLAIERGWLAIPSRWNPWAVLQLDESPNILTSFKLARLTREPDLCQRVLATSDLDYELLEDRATGADCGFKNAVTIRRTTMAVDKPFSLTCRAAVSLALWERHTLQPAAQATFGEKVVRLEHFGSYSCRNVYGRSEATRSRHATAEALDVAGFVLADGQRIRILSDWGSHSANGQFLRDVRDGACMFFDGVLGPEYNQAHRDHFHLDRGGFQVCR